MATSRFPHLLRRRIHLPNPNPIAPRASTAAAAAFSTVTLTPRVATLADEISALTLLEAADLAEALRGRLGVDQLPAMAILTGGAARLAAAAAGAAAPAAAEEAKEEKTSFDVKLESFDAAGKLKIIKELRSFTDLGLKEAKELVEKAPAVLKSGVLKEDAEKIVEKMKAIGAKVVLQ